MNEWKDEGMNAVSSGDNGGIGIYNSGRTCLEKGLFPEFREEKFFPFFLMRRLGKLMLFWS